MMYYGTFVQHCDMDVTSRQCITYNIKLKHTELCLHGEKHSATDGYPCGFAHDLYELRLVSLFYADRWADNKVSRFIGQAMDKRAAQLLERYILVRRDANLDLPDWAHGYMWFKENLELDYRPELGDFGIERDRRLVISDNARGYCPPDMPGFFDKLKCRVDVLSSGRGGPVQSVSMYSTSQETSMRRSAATVQSTAIRWPSPPEARPLSMIVPPPPCMPPMPTRPVPRPDSSMAAVVYPASTVSGDEEVCYPCLAVDSMSLSSVREPAEEAGVWL